MNKWMLAPIIFVMLGAAMPKQSYADDNLDDATEAFKEGIALFDQGEYEKAATAFRHANKLNFNWKILYNIGQSEASSKRYGLALEAFETYLAQAGDDIDIARKDEVLGEVQRLKLMVGSIDIDAPEGSQIYIDGELRGTTPLAGPILVPSGITHTVEIKKGDQVMHTQPVKLSSGQSRTVTVDNSNEGADDAIENTPDSQKSASATDNKDESTSRTETDAPRSPNNAPGVTLIALGGAALIAGAVTGTIALKRGKSLESDYPDGVPDTKVDEMDSVDKLALTTDVLLGVGIVAATVGTILLIRNKRHASESLVTATPVFGPQLTGFALKGRF